MIASSKSYNNMAIRIESGGNIVGQIFVNMASPPQSQFYPILYEKTRKLPLSKQRLEAIVQAAVSLSNVQLLLFLLFLPAFPSIIFRVKLL